MTTILVGGVLANKYRNGGAAWTRLNWILGLKQLGFDVHFVEQISRDTCVDAGGSVTEFARSVNLAYFREITAQFGLSTSSTLVYESGKQTYGLRYPELLDLARSAPLLVNIAGHLMLEAIKTGVGCRVFIDLDPGYIHYWMASGSQRERIEGHDYYFTVGENVGTPACSIPTGGIEWRPIRQPVVLDQWPVSSGAQDRFTTIASWRGPYGPVEYGGRTFTSKVHQFRKFLELPHRVEQEFELALDIDPVEIRDIEALRDGGWRVVDPRAIVPDPGTFRQYVQSSGAEFSVAQGMYVDTNSGWFSDRTVRYLASGKPALVQDTGFTRNLPVGEGLLAFRTLEDAVQGARQIGARYDDHAAAARHLAEHTFDSARVLGRLLDQVHL